MKWGVRKKVTRQDNWAPGKKVSVRKAAKLDKEFAKNAETPRAWVEIHNAAAMRTNALHVDRINSKPEYRDGPMRTPGPLQDKYMKEHQDAFLGEVRNAAASAGTNASGTKRLGVALLPDGGWALRLEDVKHADDVDDGLKHLLSLRIKVVWDKGHIVELIPVGPGDDSSEVIKHYGTKGMKWGVRKERRKANRAMNKATKAAEKAESAKAFNDYRKALRPSENPKTFDTNTKEGRKAARRARTADIDRARERVNSGALKADRKELRPQYKKEKIEMGSRAARKLKRERKRALDDDFYRSQEYRNGTEAAVDILSSIGEALLTPKKTTT